MARVFDWDGQHLPAGLKALPPGRYVAEPLSEPAALTPDEEEGIRQALASLEAGRGQPLEDARRRILAALNR